MVIDANKGFKNTAELEEFFNNFMIESNPAKKWEMLNTISEFRNDTFLPHIRQSLVDLLMSSPTDSSPRVVEILKNVRAQLIELISEGNTRYSAQFTKFKVMIEGVLVSNDLFLEQTMSEYKKKVQQSLSDEIDASIPVTIVNESFTGFWNHFADYRKHTLFGKKLQDAYVEFFDGKVKGRTIDYDLKGFIESPQFETFKKRCIDIYKDFLENIVPSVETKGVIKREKGSIKSVEYDANNDVVLTLNSPFDTLDDNYKVNSLNPDTNIKLTGSGGSSIIPKRVSVTGTEQSLVVTRADARKLQGGASLQEKVEIGVQYHTPGITSEGTLNLKEMIPLTLQLEDTETEKLQQLLDSQPASPTVNEVDGKKLQNSKVRISNDRLYPIVITVNDDDGAPTRMKVNGVVKDETPVDGIATFSLDETEIPRGVSYTVELINITPSGSISDTTSIVIEMDPAEQLPIPAITNPTSGAKLATRKGETDFLGKMPDYKPGDIVRVWWADVTGSYRTSANMEATVDNNGDWVVFNRDVGSTGTKKMKACLVRNGKESNFAEVQFRYEELKEEAKFDFVDPPQPITTATVRIDGEGLPGREVIISLEGGSPLPTITVRNDGKRDAILPIAGLPKSKFSLEAVMKEPGVTGGTLKRISRNYTHDYDVPLEQEVTILKPTSSLIRESVTPTIEFEGTGPISQTGGVLEIKTIATGTTAATSVFREDAIVTSASGNRTRTIDLRNTDIPSGKYEVTVIIGGKRSTRVIEYEASKKIAIDTLSSDITTQDFEVTGSGIASRDIQFTIDGGAHWNNEKTGLDGKWRTLLSMAGRPLNDIITMNVRIRNSTDTAWLPTTDTKQFINKYEAPSVAPEVVTLDMPTMPITTPTIPLSGTGVPGRTVTATVNGTALSPVTVQPDGTWQTIVAINTIPRSIGFPVRITMTNATGTGTIHHDAVLRHEYEPPRNEARILEPVGSVVRGDVLTIKGDGPPNQTRRIRIDGGPTTSRITRTEAGINIKNDGSWEWSFSGLMSGRYTITVVGPIGDEGAKTFDFEQTEIQVASITDPSSRAHTGEILPLSGVGPANQIRDIEIRDTRGAPIRTETGIPIGADGKRKRDISGLETGDYTVVMLNPSTTPASEEGRKSIRFEQTNLTAAMIDAPATALYEGTEMPLSGRGPAGQVRHMRIWQIGAAAPLRDEGPFTIEADGKRNRTVRNLPNSRYRFEVINNPGAHEVVEGTRELEFRNTTFNIPPLNFQRIEHAPRNANIEATETILIPATGNPDEIPVSYGPNIQITTDGGASRGTPHHVVPGAVIAFRIATGAGYNETRRATITIGNQTGTIEAVTTGHGAVILDRPSQTIHTSTTHITGQVEAGEGIEAVRVYAQNPDGTRGPLVGQQQLGMGGIRNRLRALRNGRSPFNPNRFDIEVADIIAGVTAYEVVSVRRDGTTLVESPSALTRINHIARMPEPMIGYPTAEQRKQDPVSFTVSGVQGNMIRAYDRRGNVIGKAALQSGNTATLEIPASQLKKGDNKIRFRQLSPDAKTRSKPVAARFSYEYDPIGSNELTITEPGANEEITAKTVTLKGKARPNQKIVLYKKNMVGRKRNTFRIETTADNDGNWTAIMGGLRNGKNVVFARATDAFGKMRGPEIRREFRVNLAGAQNGKESAANNNTGSAGDAGTENTNIGAGGDGSTTGDSKNVFDRGINSASNALNKFRHRLLGPYRWLIHHTDDADGFAGKTNAKIVDMTKSAREKFDEPQGGKKAA